MWTLQVVLCAGVGEASEHATPLIIILLSCYMLPGCGLRVLYYGCENLSSTSALELVSVSILTDVAVSVVANPSAF